MNTTVARNDVSNIFTEIVSWMKHIETQQQTKIIRITIITNDRREKQLAHTNFGGEEAMSERAIEQ